MAGRKPSERKLQVKISFTVTVLDRARRAAYWEGYRGEREFSEFVCVALGDWLERREMQRRDRGYPEIPPE